MVEKKYSTSKGKLVAFFSMLFGALLMVILVVSFNKQVKEKEDKVKKPSRSIEMKKTTKKVAAKPKPKPKPKPRKAQPKAPMPNLNALLSGISMNIPEFSTDDIAGDASDLLDDIAEDTVMSEGTVDNKPKVLSRAAMEFPANALKNNIKGYVIMNLLIDKDGNVEIAKVLESHPVGIFDATALNGVRGWKFGPAKYKGKPVKVWAKQKIRFD